MKTTLTIIILFLSINLMGQIDSTSEPKLDTTLMVIYDDYYNDDVYVEFNFKAYVDSKIDKRIVELWDEYVLEFMNDSILSYPTIVDHASGVWVGVDQYGRDLRLSTSKPEWIHPTPTLPDFMDFIRCKIANK